MTEPITCLRCGHALQYMGSRDFHEGTRWGVLGEVGELFVNKSHFDVHACPRCGHVELFVEGIGEELRAPSAS
jgi:predicted nucleic-acid-binding Zn-ribbon protein